MTVGWGIIGIGRTADLRMAPAIVADRGSTLVGVVSRDQGRAGAFAARHGAVQATTSYEALLANPAVDAVLITTPNALHPDQVVQAAAAGKHVLCDKPLAIEAAPAAAAVAACRRAGVRLGVVFQTRHHPVYAEVRRRLQAGEIGPLRLLEVRASLGLSPLHSWRTDPALAGLGVVNNVGVHALDLVRFLTGAEFRELVAVLGPGVDNSLETTARIVGRLSDGSAVTVTASQALPEMPNGVAAHGDGGSLAVAGLGRLWEDGVLEVSARGGRELVPEAASTDAYQLVIEDFRRAVETGGEPLANGDDGLRSLEVTAAIARSARQAGLVPV
ncbi:MAG TPA: Gfo/Idh/MocA family oxidoreductase, partial [Candidatus Dormibacteraeota bacterium]|nr:Gfo/Idh/MocA family oxidoreductase [Candidatus Dormibacteraeota bacterium]